MEIKKIIELKFECKEEFDNDDMLWLGEVGRIDPMTNQIVDLIEKYINIGELGKMNDGIKIQAGDGIIVIRRENGTL